MPDSNDDRQRLLETLDSVSGVLHRVYRAALIAALLLVLWVVWRVVSTAGPGFGSQGEWFLLGGGLLMALIWLAGQFLTLRRHERRRRPSATMPYVRTRTGQSGGARMWQLSIGRPPDELRDAGSDARSGEPSTLTWEWSGSLGALPGGVKPKVEDLERVRLLFESGYDVDGVIRLMYPGFDGATEADREVWRAFVRTQAPGRSTTRPRDD